MDPYGIGAAIKSMVRAYQHAARGTGRTTLMVNAAKSSDHLIVASLSEGRLIERMCAEAGKTVSFVVADPGDLNDVFMKTAGLPGNLLFDHTWVESYFLGAIDQAARNLAHLATHPRAEASRSPDQPNEAIYAGKSLSLLPHQQRVVDEHRELTTRLNKLIDFTETDDFSALPEAERARLRCQAVLMTGYAEVLDQRIRAFIEQT